MWTVKDTVLDPLGDEAIADLSSAVSLSPPKHATMALIQVFTKNVRVRFGGSTPTANTGHILYADDPGFWVTSDLTKVRLIQAEATATAFVSYFK